MRERGAWPQQTTPAAAPPAAGSCTSLRPPQRPWLGFGVLTQAAAGAHGLPCGRPGRRGAWLFTERRLAPARCWRSAAAGKLQEVWQGSCLVQAYASEGPTTPVTPGDPDTRIRTPGSSEFMQCRAQTVGSCGVAEWLGGRLGSRAPDDGLGAVAGRQQARATVPRQAHHLPQRGVAPSKQKCTFGSQLQPHKYAAAVWMFGIS